MSRLAGSAKFAHALQEVPMSVATELPPVVYVPKAATSTRRRQEHGATVLAFRPPAGSAIPAVAPAASLREAVDAVPWLYPVLPAPARASSAARASAAARSLPVRLTRRGYVALGLLVASLTVGLGWLAHSSALAASSTPTRPPAVVTVEPGDTLWSIASRVAPRRDPREVVAGLERVNHLSTVVLQPGQRLRTR